MKNDLNDGAGAIAKASTPEIIPLPLLRRSPTNPRTHFDQGKIQQLAGSIRQHGLIQPLLVRPAWCVGWAGGAAPGERDESWYEIVAGERRYRASLLAELTEVSCVVRSLSDVEALELQLIENLQRDDLDAIEEAEGLHRMLELRYPTGAPIHTVETVAERINCTQQHVWRRLKLRGIPDFAKAAVRQRELSVRVAELIARVPEEIREAAARDLMDGTPQNPGGMTFRQADAHLREHYMTSTKKAAFDLTDAALLPGAGACTNCPHLAANAKTEGVRGDMCLNPSCFRRKEQAQHARWVAEQSSEAGAESSPARRVLTPAENAISVAKERFNFFKSGYVGLDDKPEPTVRGAAYASPDATWRELIRDRGVTVVVGRTESGKPIEGVALKQAVAAAQLNGHAVHAPGAAVEDDDRREDKKRTEAKKRENLTVLRRLLAKSCENAKVDAGFWLARTLAPLVETVGEALAELTGRSEAELRIEMESGIPSKVCGLAAQALLVHASDHLGELDKDGLALLKVLGLDAKAERKAVVSEGARRVLVDVRQDHFCAVLVIGGKPSERREFKKLEPLAEFARRSFADEVLIDAGFRTPEVSAAADAYGWRALKGPRDAKELAEIESVCGDRPAAAKKPPAAKKATVKKPANVAKAKVATKKGGAK